MEAINGEFIRILSDYINSKETVIKCDFDWDDILKLSQSHQVDGIIYCQCNQLMPDYVQSKYEERLLSCLYYFKKREKSIEKVREAFKLNNISHFFLKGMEIAKYYPHPYLRTMGDVDIVVHYEDLAIAKNTLIELGFEYIDENPGKELILSDKEIFYDLHHRLIYDEVITKERHAAFYNNCWIFEENNQIQIDFQYLFLISHLRKHLMNEGVGFRQFVDLAMIAKHEHNLNWNFIKEKLEYLGLLPFAQVCFGLIEAWFDVHTPLSSVTLTEEFSTAATRYITANGIFGHDNPDNINKPVINKMNTKEGPRFLRHLWAIMDMLFPKYEYLQTGQEYLFLKGKPWKLPVAWLYRLYKVIIGKKSNKKIILHQLFISNKEYESKEKMLRDWKLM